MGAGTYERKSFVGGAPATTVVGSLTDAATSFDVDDATGWPAPGDPFVAVIDRGLATEEKILVGARTTDTLSSITRGYDDTTAQAHSAGAAIEHVLDASTIDQANRLANIMTTKGDVIVSDGTNPQRVAASGTDGHVLQEDSGETSGQKFARLVTILDQGSAPTVSDYVRLWYDSTNGVIRTSNGTVWRYVASFPKFADSSARDTYFGATPNEEGLACILGTGASLSPQVWDGSNWVELPVRSEGIPKFADTTARDAFYTSPADGDHAYITGTNQLLEYRQDEWIAINQKVTCDASQPTGTVVEGDLWLQPS